MSAPRLAGLALLVLPLASVAAEPLHVSGRILAADGRGQAGVRVELFPAYEDQAAATRRLKQKAESAPLAAARTGADGSFEVTVPESGAFRVIVQADGYLPMEYPLLPLVENTALPITYLVRGQPLQVQTLDTDGRPLAGIEVQLTEARSPWSWESEREEGPLGWRIAERKGISGGNGRLTLPRLQWGMPALTATSLAFLGQGTSSPQGSSATLRLSSRQAVTIEVQDADGKPVPGALIYWHGLPVAATGADGRCSMAVPDKEPPLAEGPQGWSAKLVRPAGNGTDAIHVRLEPPRRIAGKVIDLGSGRPVVGALVWSGWPLLSPVARTNAEGAFQVEVPAGEENWLQAAAAGFLPSGRQAARPGAAGSNVLKLTPAVTLAGVVVDAADRPLAGVQIVADISRGGTHPGFAVAQSRADGGFRLSGLRPGTVYQLIATREGFSRTALAAPTAPAGRSSALVRIVMREGKTVFGRVTNETGQPIVGAEVRLTNAGIGRSLTAVSGEEGRFEFRHLDAGTCHVLARAKGYSYASLSRIEIPAEATAFDLGTLTLLVGAAIEGQVTDARGATIVGAEVNILPAQSEFGIEEFLTGDLLGDVNTGPDGGFRFDGLRRGERYNLSIQRAGYVAASAPGVQAPTPEPVRIEMKAARSIAGRVVGPSGEPIAGATLTLMEELRFGDMMTNSESSLGSTDPEGRFRVTGLPAGSVGIAVSAEGYETRQVEGLQIPEEKDLEGLEITLRQGAMLEVQVLDAQGEPVPDVSVNAEPEKPLDLSNFRTWRPGFDHTDYRGRCRLDVTEAGAYRVTAMKPPREVSAKVLAGRGRTAVELRLPASVELSGRVLESDGQPAQEAWVNLGRTGGGGGGPSVPVATDGTFVFPDIPDGEYRLKAESHRGKVSAPLEVRIAGQPLRDLELKLDRDDDRATLSGHIVGLAKEELRRVTVTAFPTVAGTYDVSGKVGPEGEYRIEKLAPGKWMVHALLGTSRRVMKTIEIEPGATSATLDLEFPSGGLTLSGRVALDGTPLVGAMVAVGKQGTTSTSGLVQTAWDGSFTLSDLEPGTTTLFVFNMNGIGASRTVELTESQEITIELTSGRLRGTVATASGGPAEDAVVTVAASLQEKASFPAATIHTGPDGAFEAPRLVSGPYRITVEKDGFTPAELTVDVPAGGEKTVEIFLKPRGTP